MDCFEEHIKSWEKSLGTYPTITLCVLAAHNYAIIREDAEMGRIFYTEATRLLNKFIGPVEEHIDSKYKDLKKVYGD